AKNSKANRYDIYRATETKSGKMSSYKLIKSVSASHTTYDDSKLQSGKLYGYKVVAKRTSGSLNAFSSAKGVKDITNLTAPKKIKQKKASDNKIKLTWKKVRNATCYEVYRDGKLIKTTKKTKYTDNYDGEAATIQYSVKAVRKWHKKKFKSAAAEVDAYSGDVMDGTWVEVSIKKQMLYMYVHGKLYVKTPVVTGNAGALSTTKGHHHVLSKSSPSRLTGSYAGKSWDVTVNYWLGFTGDGQGIHDSTWRSAYGGSIYKGNGSHGCVNTPLGAMKKIYEKGYIGMPVIVH
ncbi:MAG: L,D-transpeptidase, partial [Eubacterium sp.]|nr:L,D-transpeptidase [Eubacterium sp.]